MGLSTDILQRFLTSRLFEIGPDDDRLERLRAAAADVAVSLASDRSRTVKYASVAFDPDVPVGEPVLAEIASQVEKRWNTYLSCFSDTPRVLYRAVLLEALRQAQEKDVAVASAVTLICHNLVPHLNVGSERQIWEEFLCAASARPEAHALADSSDEIRLPTVEFEFPKLKANSDVEPAEVNRESLTLGLQAASGPSNMQGAALNGPNSNWPNQGPPWSHEFAPRAAVAVADAVDAAFLESLKSFENLNSVVSGQVTAFLGAARSTVQQLAEEIARGAVGLRRRTELLWWKEAIYSQSANLSYRMMPPAAAALLMAFDLSQLVPEFCPISVQFFLREAVAGVVELKTKPGKTHPKSIVEIFLHLLEPDLPKALQAALARHRSQANGRKPLVALLADCLAADSVDAARFRPEVGIDATAVLSFPDLSVWFFREIQALRATA